MGRFTAPAVALAGLVDGVNPCAIGTLVFFMSLLFVCGVGGLRLLLVGISFCLASFLVYVAIGLGLLRALHAASGFPLLRRGVDLGMLAALGILAFLSFRDAWRYGRGGRPADVTLQLPRGVKERIHRVMRRGLGSRSLALGAFGAGAAVTALESVCTGQVYVPTLALVAGEAGSPSLRGDALRLLLLYNLMFMVPLVAVFAAAYGGMKSAALLDWSRRNVAPSKVLLGLLFLLLAAMILALRA